jgi:hypothetical protein
MPTQEQIREAIEQAVRANISAIGGDWNAVVGDTEVQFRPSRGGWIEIFDDEGNQKHLFSVRVVAAE